GFLHTSQHSGVNISCRVSFLIESQSKTGYQWLFNCKHTCKRSDFTRNSVVSGSFVPAVLAIRTSGEYDFLWVRKRNGFAFCWCEIIGTVRVEGVSSTLRNLVRIKFQIFEVS